MSVLTMSEEQIRGGHEQHRLLAEQFAAAVDADVAANRIRALVHRYFSLIEDRSASILDLHELFADSFLLEFTMVTITNVDELAAWVSDMHQNFAAYTLVVLDLSIDDSAQKLATTVTIDLELHGIAANGDRRELSTRHVWTVERTPGEQFDSISAITVEHRE